MHTKKKQTIKQKEMGKQAAEKGLMKVSYIVF
jgi:hypothetical protein